MTLGMYSRIHSLNRHTLQTGWHDYVRRTDKVSKKLDELYIIPMKQSKIQQAKNTIKMIVLPTEFTDGHEKEEAMVPGPGKNSTVLRNHRNRNAN